MNEEMDDTGFWTCNIHGWGRVFRLVFGIVLLGSSAWFWWGLESAFWAAGFLALGTVALFEGLRGWCVLRAFGMRTPF